jgi:hypothetical protein
MATLCQQSDKGMVDAALIQQPWIYMGQITGVFNFWGTVFSVVPSGNVRYFIFTKNHINVIPFWGSVLWMQQW